MLAVDITESILDSMKLGYTIPSKDLKAIGMDTEEDFYHKYEKDIETIAECPDEPECLEYVNPQFKVINTILGEIQADDGENVGQMTYHLVDIGVSDKVLGVVLELTLLPQDTPWEKDYRLEDKYVTVLSKNSYTDYLMVVEDEEDIS